MSILDQPLTGVQFNIQPSDIEVELAGYMNWNWDLMKRNAFIRSEFENFKQQVRCEAISVRSEMDWCLSGLNEHLRNLGLDEYHETFSGRCTVSFDFRVENAESLDVAETWARDVFSRAARDFSPNDGDVEILDSDIYDFDVDSDE